MQWPYKSRQRRNGRKGEFTVVIILTWISASLCTWTYFDGCLATESGGPFMVDEPGCEGECTCDVVMEISN